MYGVVYSVNLPYHLFDIMGRVLVSVCETSIHLAVAFPSPSTPNINPPMVLTFSKELLSWLQLTRNLD